jgi:nicotinate-nucleotide pyrophosphorylase
MEQDKRNLKMETLMLDNMQMENLMEMVNTVGLMVVYMKVSLNVG